MSVLLPTLQVKARLLLPPRLLQALLVNLQLLAPRFINHVLNSLLELKQSQFELDFRLLFNWVLTVSLKLQGD